MHNMETPEEGAVVEFSNDGGLPGSEDDALRAPAGARGMIGRKGLEEAPQPSIFPVRFEAVGMRLGPPSGAWPAERRTAAETPT